MFKKRLFNNRKMYVAIVLLVFAMCITGFMFKGTVDNIAEAANPMYLLNGTYTYLASTVAGTTTGSGSGSTIMYGSTSVVEMRIREDGYTGTETINKGTILTLQKYNIEARAINVQSHKRFILKRNGTVIINNSLSGNGTILLYSGSLSDGIYELSYEVDYVQGSTSVNFTFVFNFKTDCTKPTSLLTSGGEPINSGTRVKGEVTYSATDASGIKYIYFKRGSGVFSRTTSSVYTIPTSSNDGDYYFFAVDNAGNISETVYVTIDNTSPLGKLYLDNGALVSSGTVTNRAFKYTAIDPGGIENFYIKRPGGNYESYIDGTLVSGQNGTYYFKAIDTVGNESIESSIIYDNTPPVVIIKAGNNIVESGSIISTPRISAISSDTGSGVENMEYIPPAGSSYIAYISGTELTADGIYYFRAKDMAGNISSVSNVTIDNTLPIGELYLDSGALVTSGHMTNKTFKYTATDENGIKSMYLKRPGGTFESYIPNTLVSGANGTYIFKCLDNAGNESIESSIVYDNTSPVVAIKAGNNIVESGSIINAPRINAFSNDTGSGVEKMEYIPPGASTYSIYIAGTELTAEGKYYFRAKDNAGNISSASNVTIDNTIPVGKLYLDGGTIVASGHITNKAFKYAATDVNGIKRLYLKSPGGIFENYLANTLVSGANGTYYFKAVDNAGNESVVSTIVYDDIAPSGQITLSDGTAIGNGQNINKEFKYSATDIGGIKKLQLRRPNGGYEDYEENTLISGIVGLYRFRAEDMAGNISSESYVFYDPIAPEIKIKAGEAVIESGSVISVEKIHVTVSDVGTGTDMVEYIKPGSTTFEGFDLSSYIYAEGNYVFRAVDKAGNVSNVVSVTLDKTRPVVKAMSGEAEVQNGAVIRASIISAYATDTVSGIAKIEYKSPQNASYATYTSGTELTGEGVFFFRAIDNAGNISYEAMITLDTTSPIGEIYLIDGTKVETGHKTNKPFKYTAFDENEITNFYVKRPGSTFESYTKNIFIHEPDGIYSFCAVDIAGNESAVYEICFDSTSPIINLMGDNGSVNNGSIVGGTKISAGAVDEGSGVLKMEYMSPSMTSYSTYIPGYELIEEGKYYFKATDYAGNVSSVVDITLDKTPPVLTIKEGLNTIQSGSIIKAPSVKALATDSLSGVKKIEYKFSDFGSFSEYTEGTVITEEGIHEFRAIDNVGNVSYISTVILDRTAPIIKIEANGVEVTNKYINKDYLNIFGVDEYSSSSVYIKKENSEFLKIENGIFRYDEGTYMLYAEDALLNRSEYLEIVIDYTSPETKFISQDSDNQIFEYDSKKYTSKPFSFCILDETSHIKNAYIKRPDDTSWQSISLSRELEGANGYKTISYIDFYPVSGDGEYGFYAMDFAGNESVKRYITVDRVVPVGEIYYAGNYEGANYVLLEDKNLISARDIKYVSEENVLKMEVMLPETLEFAPYTAGSGLSEEGMYTFRCIDFAKNVSIEKSVWVDRTAEVPEIQGLRNGLAEEVFNLCLIDSSAKMFVNNIEVERNIDIYTVPNGRYEIMTVDLAGNIWTTSITANPNYFNETYPLKEWYEGIKEDGTYSYSSYENALEAMSNEEFETIAFGEWNEGTSWNSGIMRDPVDEKNARPGMFYIYKSENDENTMAAYFTVERLIEVATMYAGKKISKVKYFEKEPALADENNNIYITETSPDFVVNNIRIKKYLQYEINGETFNPATISLNGDLLEEGEIFNPNDISPDGELLEGTSNPINITLDGEPLGEGYIYKTEETLFEEPGVHEIVIKDLFGNSHSMTVKIVRQAPDIYIKSTLDVITENEMSGYIKVQERIRTYYYSSSVDLTINESIDADGYLLIKDNTKNVLFSIEKGLPLTLNDVGIYYIQSVNRYYESLETEVQISLNPASIFTRENISNKNLEVEIAKSKDLFANIKNIKIEKSIDEGVSYTPLVYDDYGLTINHQSFKYKFRTSGIYKITVSDPFRHGDGSVTAIYKYIKPVPEGELAGVLDGGITNKAVSFNWKDEAYATIFKSSISVSTYKAGSEIKLEERHSKNEKEYIKGTEILEEGLYIITLKDYDGNLVNYSFAIKTTPPNIRLSGVTDGGHTSSPVVLSTFDENLTVKATKNGKAFTYKPGVKLTSPGRYELLFKDEAGNLTEYSFEIVEETKNNSYVVWIILASLVIVFVLISALMARRKITKYKRKHTRFR